MKKRIAILLSVLLLICIGTVNISAEPAYVLDINVSFNDNHTFSNLNSKLNDVATNGVELSWVTVQERQKQAPLFTPYEGDFSDTSNVFLRVKYTYVNDINIQNIIYKLNGRSDFFKDESDGNLNDWISYNNLFNNNSGNNNSNLNPNFDQNGNLVITNTGALVLGDYQNGTITLKNNENNYSFDSTKITFVANSQTAPEHLIVNVSGTEIVSGTYTIEITATDKNTLTIGNFPIGGPGPGPSVDDRFEVFQDDTGGITIRPKQGVTNAPDLGAYVVINDLSGFNEDSGGRYNWNDIEGVVGANCISFEGQSFGEVVYNYKNKDGHVFENIHYNSANNSITIDSNWVLINLEQDTYRVSVNANNQDSFSVGDLNISSGYAYRTGLGENQELRYGFYDNKNGTLTTSGWGDYHVMSNEVTSIDLLFGVATYDKSNSSPDANAIPDQKYFDEIDIKNVYLILDPALEGKVSTGNVSSGKLAEMNAKKITASFESGSHGVCYVVVNFKIGESQETHCAYIKLMLDASEDTECVLDMQGKTQTQIIQELNNTFASLSSLTTKFPQIKPATNPNDMSNVIIRIANAPEEVVTGDIIWNVSGPNNLMDHNNYIVIGNGLSINGTFTNNGETGVTLDSFMFINQEAGSTEKIAVNPNVGDISLSSCEIYEYTYGIKTHKNGDTRTGFVGYIDECVFGNCDTAVSLENIKNFTGMRYMGLIQNNVFKNCKIGLEILDIMQATNDLNAMYSHSFDAEYNYFLNNDLDIHIKKSSNASVADEYYYFPNNYFGSSATQITNKNYRTASIVKDNHVIVCTSPALMFPEVNNKIGQIGIDNQAITAMRNGVEYLINTRSKFKGAVAISFNPDTGLPYGTSILNNFGIKNY